MEDNSTMPSLQDVLGDFDLSRLEEFAESLLADVTTELEDAYTASSTRATKNESTTIGVSKRVVGTPPEQLESSKNTTRSIEKRSHKNDLNKKNSIIKKIKINDEEDCDNETLYGTYDEKTNSITIVYPDDSIPKTEAMDEIICETNSIDDDFMSSSSSPSESNYLSLTHHSDINLLSPIPKSIILDDNKSPMHSIISDSGYESLGSPIDDNFSDLWNSSFSELFPSLA